MTDFPLLPSETIARARRLYDAATPNAEICDEIGMTPKQFLAFRKAQGWPLRDRFAVPPRRAPVWAQDEWEAPLENLKPGELIQRLEAAVGREFARAERALEMGRPKNAQAPLRLMATFVKMLAELRRMRPDSPTQDRVAPQDDVATEAEMQELRAELARRLERFAAEGEARRAQADETRWPEA